MNIKNDTFKLIDQLKSTCQAYGLGNDGNEYKIITQVFLYKFINDKFCYEIKKRKHIKLAKDDRLEDVYAKMTQSKLNDLFDALDPDIPRLKPYHLIANLWNQQSKGEFDLIFDKTMIDIAEENSEIFSMQTTQNTSIALFEGLTQFVTDSAERANFARALIDKLNKFSFEEAFSMNYDFFASIFEYLLKDYNTAGGGKYAEYYTPHSIATIMARLLVGKDSDLHNIECYDPSAGTGTLLMALSHQIGEDKCTIFTQDISQRSNKMLKLNLILNGLVSSLDHAIQGDTLTSPYHKSDDGQSLRQFDFVVSNPPFKMDFSDTREKISSYTSRFWAGVPTIPKTKKEKMAIYTCFIQHVINSLKENGKAAVVVPTGFITAQSGIEMKIRKRIIDNHWLKGVISMPSNIFANTGTNVSVLFIDKSNQNGNVLLMDASKLGYKEKINGNQKTILSLEEISKIENTFIDHKVIEDFSVSVSYDDIKEKNYSLSAGQYFDVKIEYIEMTQKEFSDKMKNYSDNLDKLFADSKALENEIKKNLGNLNYDI